ncbi:MaoC family dehydratase [Peteryoungia algae]|uniref:MaoC family dehydratase n=1 Tax=Peteryoungia algae TaxID=2919917 RepID=A0ABT0D5Q2_9HYPH|nr:MaoC family dehydratase [Rhizobium sp. SSM4.3]MCJ8240729.1 MaoC family dehydratase [Rhizobium sp. SSM4.3]
MFKEGKNWMNAPTSNDASLISDWITVDQPFVNRFADAVLDHQFIHVDPERAKSEGPYDGTIAHGFLSLSLLTHFTHSAMTPPPTGVVEVNYGFDKIRFLAPVPVGSRLRGKFTLIAAEAKGDGTLRRFAVEVEIEGNRKPAVAAEWLVLVLQGENR